jgi:hypothetical protein
MNRPDDGLPAAFTRLVPELSGIEWSAEPLATCSQCAMRTNPTPQFEADYLFTNPANCCTYHPDLPNFLVGRALRRGDEGSVRILKRMSTRHGVRAEGIFPHAGHVEYFIKMRRHNPEDWFGRTRMVCPYWVGGVHPCSIYADRNHVCRTWFCKYDEGARGFRAWKRLQFVLEAIEVALANRCTTVGKPPASGADRQAWVDWYLWTARHVDALTDADLAEIVTGDLLERRVAMKEEVVRRDMPLPDVVVPAVQAFEFRDDEVLFTAYSGYDRRVFQKTVFAFFAKLDGRTPWREALSAATAEVGRDLDEALVERLWRFGLLSAPEDREWKPGWEMASSAFGIQPDFGVGPETAPTLQWEKG